VPLPPSLLDADGLGYLVMVSYSTTVHFYDRLSQGAVQYPA